MFTDVLKALETSLKTTFHDISVICGKPAWGRPAVVAPLIAIQLTSVDPSSVQQLSRRISVITATWTLTVYGSSEISLSNLLDDLLVWLAACGILQVGDARVALTYRGGSRTTSQAEIPQENYAFGMLVETQWAIA